ncbi:MAG: glycosyltransferase involved in cell wall biosynthesis [Glaciecola sp.]|jgi:glycosyltransferase involved in cell wall biosynthesis
MRILIVSPGSLAVPGGNTSSILRLQDGLRGAGHQVQTCEASAGELGSIEPGSFDVVHGFHVRKGGSAALKIARAIGARLVVTLTGTETSLDWKAPEARAEVLRVLESGSGLIALRQSHLEELRGLSGLALQDAAVIPQTIRLGQDPFDLRGALGLDSTARLVLLPGGLRPVKAQDWALDVLEKQAGNGIAWHLVLMGPVLDRDYSEALLRRVQACPQAHYLGSMDLQKMGACYAACELVLNTSETEGESNAILESMQAQRTVLARSNPGNRSLIEDGQTGCLFDTHKGLGEGIQRILGDGELRQQLTSAAKEWVRPRSDLAMETRAHLRIYQAGARLGFDRAPGE